jgi:hypothetical protein
MWMVTQSLGGCCGARRRPSKHLGGFASEAHSKVIFDSSFTSCCFLKILSHEILSSTVFLWHPVLQAGPVML